MPVQVTRLRYLKQFHTRQTFIASADRPEEKNTYDRLAKLHTKLSCKHPNAKLPIYAGDGFYSITTTVPRGQQLTDDRYYTLDLKFHHTTWQDTEYVNASASRCTPGAQVKSQRGDEIDLSDFE